MENQEGCAMTQLVPWQVHRCQYVARPPLMS